MPNPRAIEARRAELAAAAARTAAELADALPLMRHGGLSARVEGGEVVYAGSGDFAIDLASSDVERAVAHWNSYARGADRSAPEVRRRGTGDAFCACCAGPLGAWVLAPARPASGRPAYCSHDCFEGRPRSAASPRDVLPSVREGSWLEFPSTGVPFAPGDGHGWRPARVLSRKAATARVEWWNRLAVRHECTVSLRECRPTHARREPTPESARKKIAARARERREDHKRRGLR